MGHFMVRAACVALVVATIPARAQEPGTPAPDAPPVSVDEFEVSEAAVAEHGHRQTHYQTIGYYSPTLRGRFKGQWMYIRRGGSTVNFWGARILQLDHSSPLRDLGLSPGDVVTRLDGIPIATGMYREDGSPWQITELENHFGRTEVRYILRGAQQVRVGDIMLDGTVPDGVDEFVPISP